MCVLTYMKKNSLINVLSKAVRLCTDYTRMIFSNGNDSHCNKVLDFIKLEVSNEGSTETLLHQEPFSLLTF